MIELINKKENLYGDGIARIEQYDFSRANTSDEARTLAITTIATVCTQKFESIGSEKLCTKLLTEAHGIPSSAYGFVPVLLNRAQRLRIYSMVKNTILKKRNEGKNVFLISHVDLCGINIEKFGQLVENDEYLLTNLRALVNDIGLEASKEFYNTDENEIAIIKKHFKVFKHKMDIRSARQFMRHTTAVWQELSRRYVSGKKVPFEFYINDKMKDVKSYFADTSWVLNTEDILKTSENHYYQAIEQGVKPQDARDILPLCTYTEIWSGWQPFALENMLTERTAIGTQWELRQTALAIKELIAE
jgi:thymidylate synthase (FAD)